MDKHMILIKTNIYVMTEDADEKENIDFSILEDDIKDYLSEKTNTKDILTIVRVFTTNASSNTAEIEVTGINENIDFINDTNVQEELKEIINNFLDIDLTYLFIYKGKEPLEIFDDFE